MEPFIQTIILLNKVRRFGVDLHCNDGSRQSSRFFFSVFCLSALLGAGGAAYLWRTFRLSREVIVYPGFIIGKQPSKGKTLVLCNHLSAPDFLTT